MSQIWFLRHRIKFFTLFVTEEPGVGSSSGVAHTIDRDFINFLKAFDFKDENFI